MAFSLSGLFSRYILEDDSFAPCMSSSKYYRRDGLDPIFSPGISLRRAGTVSSPGQFALSLHDFKVSMVKKFLDHRFLKRKLFDNSVCLLANLDKRIPTSFRHSFFCFENLAMVGDLAAILDLPLFARRPWRILPTNLTVDDRRGLLRTRLGQEYINADDIIIFFLIS